MIKLTGNVSRKVPIPGKEFSSQSFGAGMEVEVGNNATPEEVSNTLKDMYEILEKVVKEQIVSNGVHLSDVSSSQKSEENNLSEKNSPGKEPITEKQKKLIEKLAKEQEIFGKERIRLLSIKTKEEAKGTIKELLSKSKRGGKDEK